MWWRQGVRTEVRRGARVACLGATIYHHLGNLMESRRIASHVLVLSLRSAKPGTVRSIVLAPPKVVCRRLRIEAQKASIPAQSLYLPMIRRPRWGLGVRGPFPFSVSE